MLNSQIAPTVQELGKFEKLDQPEKLGRNVLCLASRHAHRIIKEGLDFSAWPHAIAANLRKQVLR